MANERFLKKQKAIWIKGKIRDKEELIKVAKCQASRMGIKGKILVVDLGSYNLDLDGQSVVVEFGCECNTPGSGSKSIRN